MQLSAEQWNNREVRTKERRRKYRVVTNTISYADHTATLWCNTWHMAALKFYSRLASWWNLSMMMMMMLTKVSTTHTRNIQCLWCCHHDKIIASVTRFTSW